MRHNTSNPGRLHSFSGSLQCSSIRDCPKALVGHLVIPCLPIICSGDAVMYIPVKSANRTRQVIRLAACAASHTSRVVAAQRRSCRDQRALDIEGWSCKCLSRNDTYGAPLHILSEHTAKVLLMASCPAGRDQGAGQGDRGAACIRVGRCRGCQQPQAA